MSNSVGNIKKLGAKGFGFIDAGGGKELYFNVDGLKGFTYAELRVGDNVEFQEVPAHTGKTKAINVKLI
ncbi:MAG: cold-shock protein [Clostridiaceae bacterium]